MRRCLLALLVLLAGCTPLQWTRPDASPEQVRADATDCQQRAWRESQLHAFGWGPGYRVGRYPYWGWGDRYYDETRLARFCMEIRGYTLEAVPRR